MSAYPNHQDIRPFYVQATDPGVVKPGVCWVDTSSGPPFTLKVRNDADSGWNDIGGTGSGGSYRQFTYIVSGGDFSFIIDGDGNPVMALQPLE